ncbi:hypothetical protein F511_30103 [Dorcoceras hygrometricum]|uniref:Uncharacterized protein n=1 Tax=Dorcoceras hygrometricum TaxID=472368 RepID=A0A2Z7CXH4_9LAMI|nr:hypothetical protein F511_30103 [Dorcoceras hygrometricum]
MTSAVMSSQSAVGNQQMRRKVKKMKRRRAEESADGLALMTSSVTSSQSADGLSPAVARYQQWIQTQATAHPVESFNEPAVAMNPVASFAYPVDMESSRKSVSGALLRVILFVQEHRAIAAPVHSSAKFLLFVKSALAIFLILFSDQQVVSEQMLAGFTTEEAEADTVADQGLKRVNRIFGGLNEGIWAKTEELTTSRLESAAKQLTIYESWKSTAERNLNGKNAQDGKNQWLRFSRANCLNSREQDLYYSGK